MLYRFQRQVQGRPVVNADNGDRNMYEQIGYCGALLFLSGLAVYDIKWRKIPVIWVLAFGIIAVLYFIAGGKGSIKSVLLCVTPGMILLLLSLLTGEKIGYGDGMAVLVLGFFLRGFLCISLLWLGIMLAGFYSLYRLLRKNKDTIPFMPFLLAALEVILFYV